MGHPKLKNNSVIARVSEGASKKCGKQEYVLVIGNEDYSNYQNDLSIESNAEFAINDAIVFAEYCKKTLGVPEKQIRYYKNATTGAMNQGISWLANLARVNNGNAELIFYYSGHGLPDETTKEAYLIPADVSGSNVTQGIKLQDVYTRLTENSVKKVYVFIDACFSGGARNLPLVSLKSIKTKAKQNILKGNIIVLTSSSGEESSGVYRDKQHGFMTYFLLKKLQESKGDISFGELSEYVIEKVKLESALTGKPQTPQVLFSPDIKGLWENWYIKL